MTQVVGIERRRRMPWPWTGGTSQAGQTGHQSGAAAKVENDLASGTRPSRSPGG